MRADGIPIRRDSPESLGNHRVNGSPCQPGRLHEIAAPRLLFSALAIGLAASLMLMVLRIAGAISFIQPLTGITRGVEFEMLYSIWQYAHGRTVYNDPNQIPFTASYYNWLHYAFYGEVFRAASYMFSLGDEWLPTVTRLTTLAGAAVGAWATWHAALALLETDDKAWRWLCLAYAVYVFFGPLLGFWAISTGPDVWPLAFAALSVLVFVRLYEAHPRTATLIVAVLTYAAWGFKQNFLYIPGAIGLFLLVRRDFANAALFTVVVVAAGLATLWIGGETYVRLLAFRGGNTEFSLEFFVRNFTNFAVKFLPVLAPMAIAAVLLGVIPEARAAVTEPLRRRPVLLIPILGIFISTIESLPTSAIINSAENHFFTLALFLTLTFLQLLAQLSTRSLGSVCLSIAAATGWLASATAIALVLVGIQGLVSVRPFHESQMRYVNCLQDLNEPFFVPDSYLALPWMLPSSQPFVVHNGYWLDIALGISKEGGGLRGLIENGYFGSVVLPADPDTGRLAGVDLSHYKARPKACGNLAVYDRSMAPTQTP